MKITYHFAVFVLSFLTLSTAIPCSKVIHEKRADSDAPSSDFSILSLPSSSDRSTNAVSPGFSISITPVSSVPKDSKKEVPPSAGVPKPAAASKPNELKKEVSSSAGVPKPVSASVPKESKKEVTSNADVPKPALASTPNDSKKVPPSASVSIISVASASTALIMSISSNPTVSIRAVPPVPEISSISIPPPSRTTPYTMSLSIPTGVIKDVEELELRIDIFIDTLRTFSDPFGFDVVGFNFSAKYLEESLQDISKKFEESGSKRRHIVGKLHFAKSKFREMVTSRDWKFDYNGQCDPADIVANAANELNIQLLALQDSYGNPNPRAENYEKNLAMIKNNFAIVEAQAEELPDVPDLTRMAVDFMLYSVGENIYLMELPLENAWKNLPSTSRTHNS